jgi:hypothetical protein
VEFDRQPGGEIAGAPYGLVEYTGIGKGTAAGLAAGPDGLYWTELYKDLGYSSPIDPGARLLRVRYVGVDPRCRVEDRTLRVRVSRGQKTRIARLGNGTIEVNGRACGATVININRIKVSGAKGSEKLTVDLAGGRLTPGYIGEPSGVSEIELSANLGGGRDALLIKGGRRVDVLRLRKRGAARLDRDGDSDLTTSGVESLVLHGGAGADRLIGNRAANRLLGGRGNDRLMGRAGRDRFAGGAGMDRCDNRRREQARSCEL